MRTARSGTPGRSVLEKAVAILDVVQVSPQKLAKIVEATSIPWPTAQRLVGQLVELGLLSRFDDRVYSLGSRLIGGALAIVAQPILDDLRDRSGELARVWVKRGDYRLCIAVAECKQELRTYLPVGTLLPLPKGSPGRILSGDPAAIRELARRGWVETINDRVDGLTGVSAAVRHDDDIIAAVGVSGPIQRVGRSLGKKYGDDVVAAAASLEAALSFASHEAAGARSQGGNSLPRIGVTVGDG